MYVRLCILIISNEASRYVCEVSHAILSFSLRMLIALQPFHNILITTSDSDESHDRRSMLLFPDGLDISSPFEDIRKTAHAESGAESDEHLIAIEKAAEGLIRRQLLPVELSPRAKELTPKDQHAIFVRQQNNVDASTADSREHRMPTILICGHGGRDQRCGITGPILKQQFNSIMTKRSSETALFNEWTTELISHIGGHKFAGNVIIYLPRPSVDVWGTHPLAGMGVWYGRVEPKHVEGIVNETILRGRITKELFRGGIDGKGGILRLANVETIVSSLDV